MIKVSTATPNYPYEVVGLVFGIGHHTEGFLKEVDPNKAFEDVVMQLRKKAENGNADEVIAASFEYRNATADGLFGAKQVLEIFGYGTAIKRL